MSQFPFQSPQQPAPQAQPQQFVYGPPAQTQQYAPPPQPYGQPTYQPAPQYPPMYGAQQGQSVYGQQPSVSQAPPPVAGTLDAFNSQPTGGGGPAFSWANAPIGMTVQATVARTVRDSDVQQDTDYKSKALKTFKDGRPQWVLVVPIMLATAHPKHPDGRASLYVKSGLRDALAAAMGAAGAPMPPQEGDQLQITLTDQKDTGQGNPKNIFSVQYHRPDSTALAPQPEQVQQPSAPVQAPEVSNGPQGFSTPAPQFVPQQPEQSLAPVQPQAVQAPVSQPQGLPAGVTLSPEQQALLAKLQGGGQS